MDVGDLTQLAQSVSREQFIARVPGWMLAVAMEGQELPMGFETYVVDAPAAKRPVRVAEVLPIAKAKGNPYPDRISVGRARNCDVVLRDPSVSKLHAHFHVRSASEFELVDLGSQNGTRVNARKLLAHAPEPVTVGDLLYFGRVSARIVDADSLFTMLR
jgi:hypothetical protein